MIAVFLTIDWDKNNDLMIEKRISRNKKIFVSPLF